MEIFTLSNAVCALLGDFRAYARLNLEKAEQRKQKGKHRKER